MMRPGESLERGEWRPADLSEHEADEAFRLALRDEVQTELDAAEAEERCQDAYLKLLDDDA
jgi:hypothetical protein